MDRGINNSETAILNAHFSVMYSHCPGINFLIHLHGLFTYPGHTYSIPHIEWFAMAVLFCHCVKKLYVILQFYFS